MRAAQTMFQHFPLHPKVFFGFDWPRDVDVVDVDASRTWNGPYHEHGVAAPEAWEEQVFAVLLTAVA